MKLVVQDCYVIFTTQCCAPTAESDSKNAAEKLRWEADKSCLANFHRKLRCCARQSDAWWDTVGQRLAGDQSNKGRDWLDLKDLGKRSRQDTTWVVFIYSPMQPFVCESCDARDTILFRQLKFSHPQGDASEGKSFPKFAKGRVQMFEVQLCCFTGSLFSLGSDKEKYLTDQ